MKQFVSYKLKGLF